ncbi:PBP1A family penicillin-binding protein [Methylocapsa polymorpha]|uniref:peptidoglycan glycosyltransferase n=1 Tax=Methylocapsa polymorpha TaxID=3080828 RepID=A0ABZ0HVK1_9HYPH|nr:PBP1A family penicillin-binding protein [Methylocapsa sp. RX1]
MAKRRTAERREPTFNPPSRDADGEGNKPRRAGARRKRRSPLAAMLYWCATLSVWAAIGCAGIIAIYAAKLPPIDALAVPKRPPNIAILADNGALLANRGDTGGAAVRIADLPPYLPKAFVAIEDRRFYSHFGVDPLGILRAATRNLIGGGAVQGGSTLTQQLAKNLFLTQERTFSRKIQEAILALWLEHGYSKNQILELYLNRVYFGSGAYGVEAATRKYFGHGARNVTLAEAATLAGLMKAPTKLAPNRNPAAARERATQVIAAMVQEGFITDAMGMLALSHPAEAVHEQGAGSVNYAADYVMDVLDDTIGAIDEDIVVSTTLNPDLQAAAEKALAEELDRKGAAFGVGQGALVAMDPDGAIKALVGGRNYADSQFDRAASAKRQPGSAFKPFVYLAALEKGLTPASVREDAPINVKGWQPENYGHEYLGRITLAKALSQSLNTVAVRLGLEVGPKAIIKVAHRLGIVSDLAPNASIALGTSEVTPLELVTAYAPFANGGIGVQAQIISKVKTNSGKLLYQRKGASNGRVIDQSHVAMMNAMMQETLLTGTARKADLPGWQAAGKTGTSQDWRDAWFIGYTSHLVTGVWLGNDDSSPTKKTSGGSLPVEIWSRFMRFAHQGAPPQPLPGGIWQGGAPQDFNPALPVATINLPPRPVGAPFSGETQQGTSGRLAPPADVPGATSRAAQAPSSAPVEASTGSSGLTPPGLIPNVSEPRRSHSAPAGGRNFFDTLFGG